MWVASSVAAGFIVYFLLRIRRALALREAELEAARSLAARRDKLASLATLAAGAAHELATPLATIAVAAKELERQLGGGRGDAAAVDDVQLIRAQVARCRGVLDQLAREAGDSTGESLVETTAAAVLRAAHEGLSPASLIQLELAPPVADLPLRLPLRSLAQALRALLKNALESSPPGAPVTVHGRLLGGTLHLDVVDHGAGMSTETLRRLGEPFFTTKPPGSGMGLGVFLCRAVFESLGGALTFSSALGQGTRATVTLPLDGALAIRPPRWQRQPERGAA
jgi:two-component system sensor histidine kinase RegB